MEPVFFDLETYVDVQYGLRRMSVPQYVLDPRFELLSVAALADKQLTVWAGDDPEWLNRFQGWDSEGRRFVCHNGLFDLRVLSLRYKFIPSHVGDTLCVARYQWFGRGSHDLDTLGEKLFSSGKRGEPISGKRLCEFTTIDWNENAKYTANDVRLCKKIWDRLAPNLPPGELELIEHTLRLCLKPLHIDGEARRVSQKELENQKKDYELSDPEAAAVAQSPAKLKALIFERFEHRLSSTDKKKVHGMPDIPPAVLNFLRSHWSYREGIKTLNDMGTMTTRMSTAECDQVLIDLNYCGAHSHRWTSGSGETGGESFNFQNMRRDSGVRTLIVPPPGHAFIIGDLAQVEARITAWYAGEQELLESFRRGDDVYCQFGRHVFGRVLEKGEDKLERQVCKQAILGLGFGMGFKKFAEVLAQQAPDALALLASGSTDAGAVETAARRIVETYRNAYPGIKRLASRAYDAFKAVASGRLSSVVVDLNGGTALVRFRPVPSERSVRIDLPTGGFLTYRDLEIRKVDSRFRSGQLEDLVHYCGMPVYYSVPIENIVQATARDVLGRMILSLEKNGFRVVLHAHDEVVVEVEAARADDTRNRIESIMSEPDPRCSGLPLSCETFIANRYTKERTAGA